jgi:dCTP deaminase
MLLSRQAILDHMKKGNVVISPFKKEFLSSASYDVSLGKYYWREAYHNGGIITYNPYSKKDVQRVWGPKYYEARPLKKRLKDMPFKKLEGISMDDLVIWIAPGETILAHTQEFIGGRNCVNTMMKARSSMGRNFIEICKDAGWGDIGYVNRWTIEVTNNSRFYHIPLVVGRRIGQITFFETQPIDEKEAYYQKGKYQKQQDKNLDDIKRSWSPEMMRPKMYQDSEVIKKKK